MLDHQAKLERLKNISIQNLNKEIIQAFNQKVEEHRNQCKAIFILHDYTNEKSFWKCFLKYFISFLMPYPDKDPCGWMRESVISTLHNTMKELDLNGKINEEHINTLQTHLLFYYNHGEYQIADQNKFDTDLNTVIRGICVNIVKINTENDIDNRINNFVKDTEFPEKYNAIPTKNSHSVCKNPNLS